MSLELPAKGKLTEEHHIAGEVENPKRTRGMPLLRGQLITAPAEARVSQHLEKMAPRIRSIVQAARKAVKATGPTAAEVAYMSQPPRSASAMWKIVRYEVDGSNVVGIGTFATYATIFFYRGRELSDKSKLLEGSGKDSRFLRLRNPHDAEAPAVKQLLREAFKRGGAARES
ncbi:MAG TPA: DUF1801 domain-containing protein [Candidatus Dormibacteraeota bacterium]|nr:DUF1801 domain-containing protein [Candidatus Dormibacteraeota bacterium]